MRHSLTPASVFVAYRIPGSRLRHARRGAQPLRPGQSQRRRPLLPGARRCRFPAAGTVQRAWKSMSPSSRPLLWPRATTRSTTQAKSRRATTCVNAPMACTCPKTRGQTCKRPPRPPGWIYRLSLADLAAVPAISAALGAHAAQGQARHSEAGPDQADIWQSDQAPAFTMMCGMTPSRWLELLCAGFFELAPRNLDRRTCDWPTGVERHMRDHLDQFIASDVRQANIGCACFLKFRIQRFCRTSPSPEPPPFLNRYVTINPQLSIDQAGRSALNFPD